MIREKIQAYRERKESNRRQQIESVARALLSVEGIQESIWPRSDEQSEHERARKLQRFAILVGPAAVFAYVFSHNEDIKHLNENIHEQIRTFKVGATRVQKLTTRTKLVGFGGEFVARQSRSEQGNTETLSFTELDSHKIRKSDLKKLSKLAKRLKSSS